MTYPCTDCIIDMIANSGPQELADLRRECKTQAVPYSPDLFSAAISKLASAGKIVGEVSSEDTTPVIFYDFPDSYYVGLTN